MLASGAKNAAADDAFPAGTIAALSVMAWVVPIIPTAAQKMLPYVIPKQGPVHLPMVRRVSLGLPRTLLC
jgi:hypothetical protein